MLLHYYYYYFTHLYSKITRNTLLIKSGTSSVYCFALAWFPSKKQEQQKQQWDDNSKIKFVTKGSLYPPLHREKFNIERRNTKREKSRQSVRRKNKADD